jgi:hypothetical protein
MNATDYKERLPTTILFQPAINRGPDRRGFPEIVRVATYDSGEYLRLPVIAVNGGDIDIRILFTYQELET